MPSLDELMREEEAKRVAETRAEMEAEKAIWDALTPEQKAAEIARVEAKYETYECPTCGELCICDDDTDETFDEFEDTDDD